MQYRKAISKYFIINNLSLGIVESITGGMLANWITNIKHSSNFFKGSLVLYQLQTKNNILHTNIYDPNTFDSIKQMALSGQKLLGCDIVIAVSGFATRTQSHNHNFATIVVYDKNRNIWLQYEKKLFLNIRTVNKKIIVNYIIKKIISDIINYN